MEGIGDLTAAAAGGFCLGVLYFAGLWLTVKKGVLSRRPWLWVLSSMVIRTIATLAGFVLLSDGNLPRLLFCTVGFAAAKTLIVWLSRDTGRSCIEKERGTCT
jgi:F1F0 ATPase subunit 2